MQLGEKVILVIFMSAMFWNATDDFAFQELHIFLQTLNSSPRYESAYIHINQVKSSWFARKTTCVAAM